MIDALLFGYTVTGLFVSTAALIRCVWLEHQNPGYLSAQFDGRLWPVAFWSVVVGLLWPVLVYLAFEELYEKR